MWSYLLSDNEFNPVLIRMDLFLSLHEAKESSKY